ncbi:LOW QUALITY PROTEIN: hypothetical protein DAPPUDRAFT_252324 [Daphnia pulex]|uniref:Uncharacterized protein n=1 Tax=Daphnia pulex TaxID=6669 RepID=E9H2G8_DAPPU|nr:LOW QUALITY PROTEIN: hypothetical protein DAPPUDRAFT_252324 [Daphnia pulex]|eukprot:EFX73977.1 LOW QUALITY PROTEIN: hypothetical protein DAPPUDRAFT_252324 [Daphnia pulex]
MANPEKRPTSQKKEMSNFTSKKGPSTHVMHDPPIKESISNIRVQDETVPVVHDETVPVVQDVTVPVVQDETHPVVEEKTVPVVQDETVPVFQDDTVPVVQDETHPVIEEETVPVFQNQTVPVFQDENEPVVQEETVPVVQDETVPVFQDATVPVVEEKGKCITCNSKTHPIRDCPEPRKKKKKIVVHVEEETVPVVQDATVPVVEEETVPEEKGEKKSGKKEENQNTKQLAQETKEHGLEIFTKSSSNSYFQITPPTKLVGPLQGQHPTEPRAQSPARVAASTAASCQPPVVDNSVVSSVRFLSSTPELANEVLQDALLYRPNLLSSVTDLLYSQLDGLHLPDQGLEDAVEIPENNTLQAIDPALAESLVGPLQGQHPTEPRAQSPARVAASTAASCQPPVVDNSVVSSVHFLSSTPSAGSSPSICFHPMRFGFSSVRPSLGTLKWYYNSTQPELANEVLQDALLYRPNLLSSVTDLLYSQLDGLHLPDQGLEDAVEIPENNTLQAIDPALAESLLVINQEVEEHFKTLWVISPFFLCPLLGHQDLLAVVKSYHRSSFHLPPKAY